jgi:hypothetical protein
MGHRELSKGKSIHARSRRAGGRARRVIMLTGWTGKVTLRAFVAAIQALTEFTPEERAFMVIYNAELGAGASTKQNDCYFLNLIAKKITTNPANY